MSADDHISDGNAVVSGALNGLLRTAFRKWSAY